MSNFAEIISVEKIHHFKFSSVNLVLFFFCELNDTYMSTRHMYSGHILSVFFVLHFVFSFRFVFFLTWKREKTQPNWSGCVHVYVAYSRCKKKLTLCTVCCYCCWYIALSFSDYVLHIQISIAATAATAFSVILNRIAGLSLILWARFDGLTFVFIHFNISLILIWFQLVR